MRDAIWPQCAAASPSLIRSPGSNAARPTSCATLGICPPPSRSVPTRTPPGPLLSLRVTAPPCRPQSGRRSSKRPAAEPAQRCAQKQKRWLPTMTTAPSRRGCCVTWRRCVRGDVHRLRAPREARGHEQRGARYAVILQSDDLPLSTLLVAPTSTSARAASFRPEITVEGRTTRVLAEQTAAVDPNRLGDLVMHLRFDELRQVGAALRLVMDL